MLYKDLDPSYRRLLRRGAQGEAEIINAEIDRKDLGAYQGVQTLGWNVTIRATFDDGSSAEFERYVENEQTKVPDSLGGPPIKCDWALKVGQTVPIRFDLSNRSRVEIDTAALRSQMDEAVQSKEERSQREPAEGIESARKIWRANLERGFCTQEQFDEQMRKLDEA